MYLIGDIGNSEIKVCLINNQKKIIKKINFSNNKISSSKISKSLKYLIDIYQK
jgi:type III pantothenate kinase